MPAISISVRPETIYSLEAAAKSTGWTKSRIAETALTRYLAELAEDEADAREAEAALARFEASGEESIPAERVYRNLGI